MGDEKEKINKNASKEELLSEVTKRDGVKEETKKQTQQDAYNAYVKQVTPTYSLPLNMLKAFLVGGIICCLGQAITNFCMSRGLDLQTAGKWTSLILILASIVLTGLNIYPSIAKFGGAGALVPITGFANGIAAPAIEFKKEGHVFGIGAQIFCIGGPVILFGIFTSWVLGLIYWILKCFGWI